MSRCHLICLFFSHLLQIPLEVVQPLTRGELNGLQLSLAGDHQFVNASLAVSLCKSWLRHTGNSEKVFTNVGWLLFVLFLLYFFTWIRTSVTMINSRTCISQCAFDSCGPCHQFLISKEIYYVTLALVWLVWVPTWKLELCSWCMCN